MRENLASMINSFNHIIIDTSALMEYESLLRFIEDNHKLFYFYDKKIYVRVSVLHELLSHIKHGNNEKKERASKAMQLLEDWPEMFALAVDPKEITVDEWHCVNADSDIISTVSRYLPSRSQVVITNDAALANFLLVLPYNGAVTGKALLVKGISQNGELLNVFGSGGLYPEKERSYLYSDLYKHKCKDEESIIRDTSHLVFKEMTCDDSATTNNIQNASTVMNENEDTELENADIQVETEVNHEIKHSACDKTHSIIEDGSETSKEDVNTAFRKNPESSLVEAVTNLMIGGVLLIGGIYLTNKTRGKNLNLATFTTEKTVHTSPLRSSAKPLIKKFSMPF